MVKYACVCVLSVQSSCCAWVGVDYIRNKASVFSGSVFLSLDVCGRAPETSLPSSVRLMPLASLCVHVKKTKKKPTGSQVYSTPADYCCSCGNDNIKYIGKRVTSHFYTNKWWKRSASGSKPTILQFAWVNIVELNHFEMGLCCTLSRSLKSSAALWSLYSGLVSAPWATLASSLSEFCPFHLTFQLVGHVFPCWPTNLIVL